MTTERSRDRTAGGDVTAVQSCECVCVCVRGSVSYHGDKSTVSILYFVCVCFTRHCQETIHLNVFVHVINVENTGVVSIFEQITKILRS